MAGLPDSWIPREESPAARTPSSRRRTRRKHSVLYLRPICLESIKFYNFVSICTFRYTGKTKNYLIINTMANKEQKLFAEFPPVTTERWEAGDHKRTSREPTTRKSSYGERPKGSTSARTTAPRISRGIRFLGSQCGEFPYVRGTEKDNDWLILQTIEVECPREANARIHRAADQGSRIHRARDRQQGVLGGRPRHAARRRLAA